MNHMSKNFKTVVGYVHMYHPHQSITLAKQHVPLAVLPSAGHSGWLKPPAAVWCQGSWPILQTGCGWSSSAWPTAHMATAVSRAYCSTVCRLRQSSATRTTSLHVLKVMLSQCNALLVPFTQLTPTFLYRCHHLRTNAPATPPPSC